MSQSDYRRSAVDRLLPLRTRGDLQVVEMAFGGEAAYAVKDPVSGEIFHFTPEEHALLTALKRPISLRGLQQELETAFAPRRAPVEAVQQFVNRVYEQGLLVGENPGLGSELRRRGRRQARCEQWASLLQILSIRLGGFDAGPLVDRIYRQVGWLISRPTLIAAVVMAVVALIVAAGRATAINAELSGVGALMRPGAWPYWLGAIVLVKALHEFGHAIACRHFGARPREMGVLLLGGVPSLYCDVSDAWRLPSKRQRIAISSAGMFVELLIAATALLTWSRTEPGIIHTVALSLFVICSVGTLAINANPLLRYDGYYILSDLLEVPNLADRARGLVGAAWRNWLLGESSPADPLLASSKRRTLWAYAIGSKIYVALVLCGLLMLMLRLARPFQLENLVYSLATVVVAGLMMRPLASLGRLVTNPALRARLRWDRLAATTAALAVAATVVALIPMNRRVAAPMVIVPANAHPLFAVAAGELEFAVGAGAEVAEGEVVIKLRNPELELALEEARGALQQQRTRLAQLAALQGALPSAARELPTAQAEVAAAEEQVAERQAMVAALTVRAPHAGRVLAAPKRRTENRPEGQLSLWTGSPLEARNLGAWIEPRTPLCVIADGTEAVAWAGVKQADVAAVAAGQSARLLVEELPFSPLRGQVEQVARRSRENRRDPGEEKSRAAALLGDARYHVVGIKVDGDVAALFPGARGVAKITAEESNVGSLVLDSLRRTFRSVF